MGIGLIVIFLIKSVAAIWINWTIIGFSLNQQVRLSAYLMHSYQKMPYTEYLRRNSSEYIHSIHNNLPQYIQENSTFLFNDKTGGTPPNEVMSFVLDVDPQALDNIVVNMDQYLLGLAKENNNKHNAWTLKNSKKSKEVAK